MNYIKIMAEKLGIDKKYILICSKRNNLYTKYLVTKHNGKKREVLQPSKELKTLQYWLNSNLFDKFTVSKFTAAYERGCSISRNALIHKNNNYILHTDIVNFFPSINRNMVRTWMLKNSAILNNLGVDSEDIEVILDIVLYRGNNLVIGSVASPRIANRVMYDFDNELFELLKTKGRFKYTRYADDIVISSKVYIPQEIVDDISKMLERYEFTINKEKTYFMNRKSRRQITGVVLDNNSNSITIGNQRNKELKRKIYELLVKGNGEEEKIKGYLAYVKDVNIEQYKRLKNIYSRYDKEHQLF